MMGSIWRRETNFKLLVIMRSAEVALLGHQKSNTDLMGDYAKWHIE